VDEAATPAVAHAGREREWTHGLDSALQRHGEWQRHPGAVDVKTDFATDEMRARGGEALIRAPDNLDADHEAAHARATGRMMQEEAARQTPFAYAGGVGRARGMAGPPVDPRTGEAVRHRLRYLNLSGTLMTVPASVVASALQLKDARGADSRGVDSVAEFLLHPSCGLRVLNLSKNRLAPETCTKLATGLDYNTSLDTLGVHSTDAGAVVGATFAAKALGLSLSHGRAALADERLGIFDSSASRDDELHGRGTRLRPDGVHEGEEHGGPGTRGTGPRRS
jgi:hypothetical protein